MCGISGIINLDGKPVPRELIAAINHLVRHRGPDDEGYFFGGNFAFGHRRLSILDLSNAGHQPMEYGGRLVIVHNGEIYNYLELRQKLVNQGYRFKSETDTEIILAAYDHWGTACVQKFNGMFAFAIWDDQQQQLFCARDRLGVKPFYYIYDGKQFVFASEIKALLATPGFHGRVNEEMVRDFLLLGIVDHTSDTFFQDVYKLPPANYMLIKSSGIKLKSYWDFEVSSRLKTSRGMSDFVHDFRHLLQDAVRLRLRSDVPVGTCLSGGIDSSSIVCMINSLILHQHKLQTGKYQKTYSSVFPISTVDERKYIAEVIDETKAESHEVTPRAGEFLKELDMLVWHQEEPFANSSIYAQWCVFRKIKESGVKVVLDGQGADEQLCGYRKFSFFYMLELLGRNAILHIMREGLHFLKNIDYFKGIDLKNSLRYFQIPKISNTMHTLFKPGCRLLEKPLPQIGFGGSLADRIKLDITRFSLPALLRYEDKSSMAFSVESRTPFLDFRVVEFLAAIPFDCKIQRGWTKYILREAMRGIIPEKIRCRRDKLAFDTPQDDWLKNRWRLALESAFSADGILGEYFDPKKLKSEYRNFLNSKSRLSGNFFFRVFLLHHWAERFNISSL